VSNDFAALQFDWHSLLILLPAVFVFIHFLVLVRSGKVYYYGQWVKPQSDAIGIGYGCALVVLFGAIVFAFAYYQFL
jgi:hypothetical protein